MAPMKTILSLLFASTLSAQGTVSCVGCADYVVPGTALTMSFGPKLTYTVSGLEDGIYRIDLTFVEPTYSTPGQRPMNVWINDTPMLTAFDIVAAGGPMAPVKRSVLAIASGGKIVIVLTANATMVAGKITAHTAILSEIAVRPIMNLSE